MMQKKPIQHNQQQEHKLKMGIGNGIKDDLVLTEVIKTTDRLCGPYYNSS